MLSLSSLEDSDSGEQWVETVQIMMKDTVISLVVLCLSLSRAADENVKTSRVCTFPNLACYDGSVRETDQGTVYHSFQGIRFAEPPTGNLRFKLPVKYEAKDELYDVSGTSDIKCMQFSWDGANVEGTEDCLFLNVYVPGRLIVLLLQQPHPELSREVHGGEIS